MSEKVTLSKGEYVFTHAVIQAAFLDALKDCNA
jgi:hypothetical protein